MQLGHLAKTFLPQGNDIWSVLQLEDGYMLKDGLIEAILKQDQEKAQEYLKKEYKNIIENKGFKSKVSPEAWSNLVGIPRTVSLIYWIRTTRKNIRNFLKAFNDKFPQFELSARAQARTEKPGEAGKAMGTSGAKNEQITSAILSKLNLLTEGLLGDNADKAGFDEFLFKKNLPQFISLLSMMYYDTSGKKLSYNEEEVLKYCKEAGCKPGGSSKKYKEVKHKDYKISGVDKDYMSEDEDKGNIKQSDVEYILMLKDIDTGEVGAKNKKGKGGDSGEIFVTGKIEITDNKGNTTWSIANVQDNLNKVLQNKTRLREAETVDNAIVLDWGTSNPLNIKGTDAIVIKPNMDIDDFINKVKGYGVSDVEVDLGKKAGNREDMTKPAKAKISLKSV
jgi:hypothetical protein